MVDDVLYHVENDTTRELSLLTLGRHLREAKVHGQLAKHYWCPA